MSQITTHALDLSRGKPAANLPVILSQRSGDDWRQIGSGVTDADGRVADLLAADATLAAGEYKLTFVTADYFAACFYPQVEIVFRVAGDGQHYHVPLLLSPFGYSTYRGS